MKNKILQNLEKGFPIYLKFLKMLEILHELVNNIYACLSYFESLVQSIALEKNIYMKKLVSWTPLKLY